MTRKSCRHILAAVAFHFGASFVSSGEAVELSGQNLADACLLEAKFGKRSLAWSQLRGIFFAPAKMEPLSTGPEITFRPAPGFTVDSLRAKLVRWDETKLIVQHGLFGEIAVERERLDRIRFTAK